MNFNGANLRGTVSQMDVDPTERRRRAKAILGYSQLTTDAFAKRAGVKAGALKNWTGTTRSAPSLEVLAKLAEAADVPTEFAYEGFEPLRREGDGELRQDVAHLTERLARLERAFTRRLEAVEVPPLRGELDRPASATAPSKPETSRQRSPGQDGRGGARG